MPKQSRDTTIAQAGEIIKGIHKDLATTTTLHVGATPYSPASLAAFIQSRIDAAFAVNTRRAEWQAAVKAEKALDRQYRLAIHDLQALVMATFGQASPVLADFGFSPPRVATMTLEQKAAAVLKRNATRAARRTMGRRQKAKIKGTVPVPAVSAEPPRAPIEGEP